MESVRAWTNEAPIATAQVVVQPRKDGVLHAGHDVIQGRHRSRVFLTILELTRASLFMRSAGVAAVASLVVSGLPASHSCSWIVRPCPPWHPRSRRAVARLPAARQPHPWPVPPEHPWRKPWMQPWKRQVRRARRPWRVCLLETPTWSAEPARAWPSFPSKEPAEPPRACPSCSVPALHPRSFPGQPMV